MGAMLRDHCKTASWVGATEEPASWRVVNPVAALVYQAIYGDRDFPTQGP